jgi:microbial collagenase
MVSSLRTWPLAAGLWLGLWVDAGALAPLPERPGPRAAAEVSETAWHVQQRPLQPQQRAPLPTARDHLFRSYDGGAIDARAPEVERRLRPVARGACDPALFAGSSGAALVAAVLAAETACINELFGLSGALAAQVFGEAKMVTIAQAMEAGAVDYDGVDDAGLLQLILFLRAGLYVQYYQSEVVGDYGPAWRAAIRPALAAFVANPHFTDVSAAHGEVLTEFVILIDSAGENARHLDTVRGLLDRFGPAHAAIYEMSAALNSVFTVLFRGHYDDAFRAEVQQAGGAALRASLSDFIARNRLGEVGGPREYLLRNAGGELARFLQYPEPLAATLRPQVKSVLDQFSVSGPGAGIYVRTAELADYYDHAHCAYYGLCTFLADLEAAVLPSAGARDCSPTLRVRSQALEATQLAQVCNIVGGEEAYFHAQAQTGGVPVVDDLNARLEMVIFHSSDDYEIYSGALFGNDTNNGGIYLEGDPAEPGNQARFLAFEAEWLRPSFEVWNLTHEYIHYLDGRFNWRGGFGDLPLDAPYSVVWYIEGFAELMSYSYRGVVYTRAVGEAANPDRFRLSQLFDTEYSSDYLRTYSWGYLATRFLYERHRDRISDLYRVSRPGDYAVGYPAWLDAIRTSFDGEFRAWVACLGANGGDTTSCNATAPALLFADGFEGQR